MPAHCSRRFPNAPTATAMTLPASINSTRLRGASISTTTSRRAWGWPLSSSAMPHRIICTRRWNTSSAAPATTPAVRYACSIFARQQTTLSKLAARFLLRHMLGQDTAGARRSGIAHCPPCTKPYSSWCRRGVRRTPSKRATAGCPYDATHGAGEVTHMEFISCKGA